MRNIVDNYVKKFKQEHRKSRRAVALLLALALLVSTGVSWQLHSTGIALTNETYCGLTEHQHDESCYEEVLVCGLQESEGTSGHTHTEDCYETQQVLVCGLEESSEHTHTDECYEEQQVLVCDQEESEGTEDHTHTEDCYETQLVCGMEEHTHTVECLIDETADVETESGWKATLPDLTGELAEDVVAVAQSQLGYTESTANFQLDDDGETRKGYTRYGAWYGNEYGDWDAMFVSFCLYYAGVDEDDFPEASGAYAWSVELGKQNLYADAEDYTPAPGDLVFFDTDDDGKIDCVGIVVKLDTDTDDDGKETVTKLYVIEGDYAESTDDTDAVCEVEYKPDDETIVGFGTVSAVCGTEDADPDDTGAEETDPDDTDAEPEETAAESVTGSGDFTYEDETVTIQVHAEGTVSAPVSEDETAEAEAEVSAASLNEDETEEAGTDELSWDNVTMEVTILDEESETYALLAEYADELNEENSELSILEVVSFSFYYDGEVVDASDWTLTAEVTPVEQEESAIALINEDGDTSANEDDEAEAVATVTYTLLETVGDSVNEAAVATVSTDEDEPTLTAADLTGNSAVMLLAASGTTDFTVEYYAYLDVVKTSTSSGTLALLDTNGGVLPTNKTGNSMIYVNLIEASSGLYQIETEKQLTQIYTSESCTVEENNDIDSVNKLRDNSGYTLSQVWISTNNGTSWTEYTYVDGMEFTNVQSSANGTSVIYIPDGALVRLVYDTAADSENIGTNLYDYDITDGDNDTYLSGINSSTNYTGSGVKLAFGNNNTSSGLASVTLNGYYINRANTNRVDYGCSFGIAIGLNSDGTIKYNTGIDAPDLFNENSTDVTGKTTYSGQTLTFSQVGDTYTLSSVSGSSGIGVTGLQYFTHLTGYTNGVGGTFDIYTNSFWLMDGITNDDGSHGDSLQYKNGTDKWTSNGSTDNWPISDDSEDHNSYFGMQYSVDFTLTADYCGPLNYLFFGDDDMWVFLTDPDGNSELVCDIGGVHSSVGEYVNLWDYITQGDTGTYTLTFFYTERGASGSSCYMQFTLPSVTSSTTVQNTGTLKVEKEVDSDEATSDETFGFTLSLKSSSGSALTNTYAYDIFNSDGSKASSGTIGNGGTFTLKDGQYILVEYLPVGTQCTVTETNTGYTTYYTVGSGNLTEGTAGSGSITNGGTLTMKFVNSTPDVEKKVQDSSGNWGDDNTTSIGSNVQFMTTISDVSGVTNLVLHDVLDTGLANPYVSSVVVLDSAGDTESVDVSNYAVTYYVGENTTAGTSTTDGCSFEIKFEDDFLATLDTGDCIVVYYYATLTEDANIGATEGNENTTRISYGSDSSSEWDTTTTYTFQIDILKYSEDEKLSGAEFILYYTTTNTGAEGGSPTTVTKYALVDDDGYLTGWTDDEDDATTLISGADGTITVKGLDAGTYYLEETKAPDGYTLLSDPVTITVGSTGTVTYTVDGAEVDASTTNNQVKVENEPGYELPLTGGTGTYWYTMAGTLLIGGAAYLLYRNLRRRKGERQL